MIYSHLNYREFLKSALRERAKTSKGYSLRAFSAKVGFSNSFLSEVLNSKKSLSVELAFKIAVRLELTEVETQYFCLLVQLEQEQDKEFRKEILKRLRALSTSRNSHDLSEDHFKSIADWYHYAILELTYVTGFKLNATSVSAKLGISLNEAESAILRLERMELLEKNGSGLYKKKHNHVLAQSQIPNGALKEHHGQILEKAMRSLHEQTPEQRMSATDILPIDSKYIPEIDRLSQEFSNSVMKLAEKSSIKDEVYALSVHFFKLTQPSPLTI